MICGFFFAKNANFIKLPLPETGLVVLLGESGSGKTTLIEVLSLLQSPNEGEISYDNQPPSLLGKKSEEITPSYLRKAV